MRRIRFIIPLGHSPVQVQLQKGDVWLLLELAGNKGEGQMIQQLEDALNALVVPHIKIEVLL